MLFYLFKGRNAARTCRHFGISRQTFYRWLRRFDRHDLRTLEGRSHRPRNIRQPTWTAALAEQSVTNLLDEYSFLTMCAAVEYTNEFAPGHQTA